VRVARLALDFVRDLHMRVLGAFGNMGFEDYRRLSDEDLNWLVQKGKSEIVKIEEDHRIADLSREASGKPTEAKQISHDQQVTDKKRKQIEPYRRELENRSAVPPQRER